MPSNNALKLKQGGEGEIITKHDLEAASRRNMRDLEEFVPHAGDLGRYGSRGSSSRGTRLSSGVTNRLKSRLKRQAQTAKASADPFLPPHHATLCSRRTLAPLSSALTLLVQRNAGPERDRGEGWDPNPLQGLGSADKARQYLLHSEHTPSER